MKSNELRTAIRCCVLTFTMLLTAATCMPAEPVAVVVDGQGKMPILAGNDRGPAEELQSYIKRITGATLVIERATDEATGVYVGRVSDFPWLALDQEMASLGESSVLVRSSADRLLLIGKKQTDVSRAVYWFLQQLGCRWFFPGETWEIVPRQKTIRGTWNEIHAPSYYRESWLHYAHGSYRDSYKRLSTWHVRNMLLPDRAPCSHSWMGLDPSEDYQEHPEWFALVDMEYGKKERPAGRIVGPDGKKYYSPHHPCYSNPQVIAKAIEFAMKRADEAAANGQTQIGASAPDWVDFCECPTCWSVFQDGTPFCHKLSWFAKRPDGTLVCATSETFFGMINKIATAVAEKYPEMQFNTVSYSCYAHPPSFEMHPNVYVQVTAGFRRTPLNEAEQITQWGQKASAIGMYAYTGTTYQFWDWPDGLSGRPGPMPGPVGTNEVNGDTAAMGAASTKRDGGTINLVQTADRLREWHRLGVRGYTAENAPSWGSRGLGQYITARLLWDVNADVTALVRDFYQQAFGPAAKVMESYYVRWYGSAASVSKPMGEDVVYPFNEDTLRASAIDLDNAMQLVADQPEHVARLDDLRAYAYLLYLRHRGREAMDAGRPEEADHWLADELRWTGRLATVDIVHTRALLNLAAKGGTWRNRKKGGDAAERARVPADALQIGEPPTHDEIEVKWQKLKAGLNL